MSFGERQVATVKSFGIKAVRTSWHCPWQNGVVERWIGSCRREMLNHVIVFGERHALKLLREYTGYYNSDRCHYSLAKDAPKPRPVQNRQVPEAKVIALPKVGGLHHRYEWRDAA